MFLELKKTVNDDTICNKNTKNEDSHSNCRQNRNRSRIRWSKKRRRASTPTPLQLHGDYKTDELDDNDKTINELEGCSQKKARSSPTPWTSERHRAFVNAIFEVGIEQSSPAVIAEQMITKNDYNTIATDQASFRVQKREQTGKNESSTSFKDEQSSLLTARNNNNNQNNLAVTTAAALAVMSEDTIKTDFQEETGELPEEAEYYKRELTGERLKSHLQKMRKQKTREKEIFLGDYNRFLKRQEIVDREEKEIQKVKEQRKEAAKRRRLKRERLMATLSGNTEDKNDEMMEDEEERLLSLYLPLRSAANGSRNGSSDPNEDFDSDCDFDENAGLSNFPAGGRAIGMLTWAVQKQEMEDRKKRKEKQRTLAKQKEKQQEKRRQQAPTPNGWETASVDSWTSHTAIAAGKFVKALGPGRRGPAAIEAEERPLDCASSEDDDTDTESETSGDGESDQFRAGLPTLTEAEKNSPLGVSLRLSWDMIKYMHGVIAEERVSKAKEKELQRKMRAQRQQQKRNQQLNSKKMPSSVEESSSENETSPETSKRGCEPTFTATADPQLLAAMASNGVPPATLMQAFSGIGVPELGTPLLLGALLGSNPSIVMPFPQNTLKVNTDKPQAPPIPGLWNPFSHNKQGSAFARAPKPIPRSEVPTFGLFKPLAAPKDSWIGLPNPFSSPESRALSPIATLSTPTTPAEAMFRSLLQQSQQSSSQDEHYPV